jgi:hypothetical protein
VHPAILLQAPAARAALSATVVNCMVPVLTEAVHMVAAYLTIERDLGRIASEADVDLLAPTLTGAAHLLFADRTRGCT